MITYGFYDSINHDRKYNSIQFGSIFDGIIQDGIFMSIGTCFRVTSGGNMIVLVGIGRAWFNHTWILNDAPLPITIPQSEVLLNRIDAIVIDIDQNQSKRKNDVILVKGTPSSNPIRPTLINDANKHQYPLAYITVNAGVTSIRAADITSMVGTSVTPYVTGILKTVNIDALLDQWRDQWQKFYETQTKEMEDTNQYWKDEWQSFYDEQTAEILSNNEFWKMEWQRWYEAQTNEIQDTYLAWQQEWTLWSNNYKTMMNNTADEWKQLWDAWFYEYINQNQIQISNWQQDKDTEFKEWFASLQYLLDGDVGTKLASDILKLKEQVNLLEIFKTNLTVEQTIYDALYDNWYRNYDEVVDSNQEAVLDNENDPFAGRTESTEPILDSSGEPIGGKIIFVVK